MTWTVRPATPADLAAVTALAEVCLPADDDTLDAPVSGELAAAIDAGELIVADDSGTVIGMLRAEALGDHVQLGLLAVAQHQRRHGVARALVQASIRDTITRQPETVISAAVHLDNVPTIALLSSENVVARRGIDDYAGPGRPRLYCRREPVPRDAAAPEDRVLVPAHAHEHVLRLLEDDGHSLTGVVPSTRGPLFEVSAVALENEHSLKVDEATVGLTEAGTIAAGLTFLLGISFAVENYSEPLRTLLLFATILTVGSVQIFASATGRRPRSADSTFYKHMKWGNLLVEYGGLYPIAIVLPSVFDQASPNESISITISVLVALALAAYEYSAFSLASGTRRGFFGHVLSVATILLPLAVDPLVALTGNFTLWSAVVGVVLVARIAWYIPVPADDVTWGRRGRFARIRAAR